MTCLGKDSLPEPIPLHSSFELFFFSSTSSHLKARHYSSPWYLTQSQCREKRLVHNFLQTTCAKVSITKGPGIRTQFADFSSWIANRYKRLNSNRLETNFDLLKRLRKLALQNVHVFKWVWNEKLAGKQQFTNRNSEPRDTFYLFIWISPKTEYS